MTLEPYLDAINQEMRQQLAASSPALEPFYEMMRYHLGLDAAGSGLGKRLRPLLCLLAYEALGGEARDVLPAAAALELLHNFTLIHDDIEDQDRTRHHRPAVWAVWGIAHAINAGDGMYALSRVAVHRLREGGLGPARIVEATLALDRACVRVCEGQFLDITFETRLDVSETQYREMIDRKTGALFRAAAEIPGLLAGVDPDRLRALATFGEHFGAAFQAFDDLKGVWGVSSETGKVEMNDIAKRKMSLPVVLAIGRATPAQRDTLSRAYALPAPLPGDEVRRVRKVLDALAVRADVERYVRAERERAVAALAPVTLGEPARGRLLGLLTEATGPAG